MFKRGVASVYRYVKIGSDAILIASTAANLTLNYTSICNELGKEACAELQHINTFFQDSSLTLDVALLTSARNSARKLVKTAESKKCRTFIV